MSDPGKHRARDQWGPREIIALVVIMFSFILAGVALVTDHANETVPAWVAALLGGVTLYLYKDRKNGGG